MSDALFKKFGKTFQENEIIFCEYEPGNDFYVIRSGKVKLTKLVDGQEKILDLLSQEGDFFGEMAILEEAPRSATAIAYDGPLECLNFNKANFDSLLQSQPQLGMRLLQSFSRRIFEARARLETLRFTDLEARIIHTLITLSEQKGLAIEKSHQIELEADIGQISSWCAVKLDQTKKILYHYQSIGKLSLKENRILLKNPQDLLRFIVSKRKTTPRK